MVTGKSYFLKVNSWLQKKHKMCQKNMKKCWNFVLNEGVILVIFYFVFSIFCKIPLALRPIVWIYWQNTRKNSQHLYVFGVGFYWINFAKKLSNKIEKICLTFYRNFRFWDTLIWIKNYEIVNEWDLFFLIASENFSKMWDWDKMNRKIVVDLLIYGFWSKYYIFYKFSIIWTKSRGLGSGLNKILGKKH